MSNEQKTDKSKERGQGLVEVAIVLPILIVLIVGVVELSNSLNTQNKVTTASRIAAGFGAANYDRANFADSTANDMSQVALNTITETLILDPDRWDIWAIRAKTNITGSGFSVFTYTHYNDFGNHQVVTDAEWEAMVPSVQQDILEALRSVCDEAGDCENAADLEIVSSVPFYRPEPILGLPLLEWLRLDRQRGLTVMRVDTLGELTSCPLLPIAVRLDQWSMYPSDWYDPETGTLAPKLMGGGRDPDHIVQPFPPFDDDVWEYPDCTDPSKCKPGEPLIPRYVNGMDPFAPGATWIPTTTFPLNVPGIEISPTIPTGHLFWAREQDDGSGNFGWLTWNGDNSVPKLDSSLDFDTAGDFVLDFDFPDGDGKISKDGGYPGSRADMGLLVNIDGYPAVQSGDGNGWLEKGEWVEGAPGNMDVSGKTGLQPWINSKRPVVILLFDRQNVFNNGQNTNYRVAGFVQAYILGYSFGGAAPCPKSDPNYPNCTLFDGKWVIFELIGPAQGCYDPPPPTEG